jgi:regulator of cell morphogenesis and NO signaling
VYKLEDVPPAIDNASTLGMLAAEQPLRIALFERLHLDYCCGGSTSLDDACTRRGLNVDSVREQIEAVDRGGSRHDEPAPEWRPREATIDELCDHIVSVHHDGMREEMPRMTELLETVVRVHGADQPDLEVVERAFASLRAELEEHIEEEEVVLFPTCRGLEQGSIDPAGVEPELIARHRTEHEAVGRKLAALRELAGGYELSRALCATHRSLLEGLLRFETDLHRHVHEENNVLLDRVDALLDGPPLAGATPVDVLVEALVELADAGRAERASRLAAKAYAGLRRGEPDQAQRLDALMHKLILSPRYNDDKE